jgi:putative ABC transport system permease protein
MSWLIVVAFVLAAPVSWWLMNKWLQGFEYKLDMTVWIFALSMLITFSIALITVGYESIKAALGDPVKSLRGE